MYMNNTNGPLGESLLAQVYNTVAAGAGAVVDQMRADAAAADYGAGYQAAAQQQAQMSIDGCMLNLKAAFAVAGFQIMTPGTPIFDQSIGFAIESVSGAAAADAIAGRTAQAPSACTYTLRRLAAMTPAARATAIDYQNVRLGGMASSTKTVLVVGAVALVLGGVFIVPRMLRRRPATA